MRRLSIFMATEKEEDSDGIPADIQEGERGTFRCLLCCISVPNRPSLNDHIRGKRHTRMCEERAKRQQQQECSVFVSGFSKGITEDQLRNVFQPISSVKNVVMDKDKGLYAIVEFENPEGVGEALARHDIKLENRRLKIKPRQKKEFKKKKIGTQNLQPPDPEALSKELSCCTDVEHQMKKVVALCSPSHHESRLRDLLLSLLKETFTEFFPACQLYPFGSSVNGFEISGCDLDLYLEMGEAEDKTEEIKRHMKKEEKATTENETECLEGKDYKEIMESEKSEHDDDDDDDIDEDESITPGLSLRGLSNDEILNLVERVLRQCVPGVHGVQTVPSARRPVVRFQHKTSGLRGDITLNNRLALRNSQYLHLCSDLDPRVPQLVYTVRYWARINQLAGNPLGGGPLLNNYALTLLIIFFLQSRKPPVIPSLSRLKELCGDEPTHVIDGWDCTFPSDPTQLPATTNEENLGCLLADFFSFFTTLDLHSSILCLRDGLIITLPFTSPLPSWAEGFRLGPFNVQDPFELSHNVCSNVSLKTARNFLAQCIDAVSFCRSPFYHLRSPPRPWGITLLLLPKTSEDSKKIGTEISIPMAGYSLEDVFAAVKRVFVELLLCTYEEKPSGKNGAESNSGNTNKSNDDEMQQSATENKQAVPNVERLTIAGNTLECKNEDVLEEQVKTDVNGRKRVSSGEVHTKNKKRKIESSDAVADVNLSKVIGTTVHKSDCKAKKLKEPVSKDVPIVRILVWHRVWEGRRKQRRSMVGEGSQRLEVEASVSRALSFRPEENKAGKPLMQITVMDQQTTEGSLELHLIPEVDPYQCSTNFFHFLKGFLPSMVQEILSSCE
ncbi:speckle targeted PIP5K1A-regulated poly(A) polymerase [Hyperolius riggenbachi]|uniref:speckle targeted PIP5K1A-regulated poly(A) polymerase n=1 Tax=Hyperolius riggenbachi TaxID=752182 RepID=UPI0035A32191